MKMFNIEYFISLFQRTHTGPLKKKNFPIYFLDFGEFN